VMWVCGTCETSTAIGCAHTYYNRETSVLQYDGPAPRLVKDKEDPVNSPGHYTRLEPQPIDVIEKWNLPFHESQVVKYIARAGHKDPTKHLEDLKKAEFYLKRKIAQLEGK
jgi:hypothetical protein